MRIEELGAGRFITAIVAGKILNKKAAGWPSRGFGAVNPVQNFKYASTAIVNWVNFRPSKTPWSAVSKRTSGRIVSD